MISSSTIWSSTGRASASLEVYLLGLVDFDSALFLQERLVYEISGRTDSMGGLLLCEHPPMISIGREGSRAHVLADSDELASRQIDVRWLNRGGGCVVHAPGQLAVYPIVPLNRLGIGLAAYRSLLEESVSDVCRQLRIQNVSRPDEPGVWGRRGQIAHLGVSVKSWVAYHGMFVNVSPALELQRLAMANSRGEAVTSLAAERARFTSMNSVRTCLVESLTSRLGYQRHHIYAGHPLLRRSKKKVYVNA